MPYKIIFACTMCGSYEPEDGSEFDIILASGKNPLIVEYLEIIEYGESAYIAIAFNTSYGCPRCAHIQEGAYKHKPVIYLERAPLSENC